jgi:hypothetical protein
MMIWLSPSTGNSTKTIHIFSDNAWTLVAQPTNATVLSTSGSAGTTPIAVTRSTTDFGLDAFQLQNSVTGRIIHVAVDNYYIDPDELLLSNTNLTNNVGEYEIEVYGGNETFSIVSILYDPGVTPWITSATILPNGKLQLTAPQSPDGEARECKIVLAHGNDPTYQEIFTVIQDINGLPPFDYLTIRFTWPSANDVDIAVEFANNVIPGVSPTTYVPFDNYHVYPPTASSHSTSSSKAMGYGLANFVNVDGSRGMVYPFDSPPFFVGDIDPNSPAYGIPPFIGPSATLPQTALMIWGGDATWGQGETVYVNAPLITPPSRREDTTGWDRYIYIDVYAGWYYTVPVNNAITVTVNTYKGGIMMKPTRDQPNNELNLRNTNFYNVETGTDSLVWQSQVLPPDFNETFTFNTNGMGVPAYTFRSVYPKMCTVRYDRYRRDARIFWYTLPPSPSPIVPSGSQIPPVPKGY